MLQLTETKAPDDVISSGEPPHKRNVHVLSRMMDLCEDSFMCAHCGKGIQRNLLVGQRHVEVGFRLFEELCVDAHSDIMACFNVGFKLETKKDRHTGCGFKIIQKHFHICKPNSSEEINLKCN